MKFYVGHLDSILLLLDIKFVRRGWIASPDIWQINTPEMSSQFGELRTLCLWTTQKSKSTLNTACSSWPSAIVVWLSAKRQIELYHLRNKLSNLTLKWAHLPITQRQAMYIWHLAMTDWQTCNLQTLNSQLTVVFRLTTCNQVSYFPFCLTSAYTDIPKGKLMQDVEIELCHLNDAL